MPKTTRTRLVFAAAFILILIATAAAYWQGLKGPLVFDDEPNLAPINDWLTGKISWLALIFENDSGMFGRPVSMASFVLNVALLGSGAWGLKLGNLLIHLCNGCLIYILFRRLQQHNALASCGNDAAQNRWIAFAGASIWLVHPLFASTVLYVVQRMAMLSALFTLLTLLAYIRGRDLLQAGRRRSAVAMLLAAGACTLLALLSKENGALAPSLCGLVEWLVFRPMHGTRRHPCSNGFIVLVLLVPALVAIALIAFQPAIVLSGYQFRSFNLPERLLTETRVLWSYVGNLLVPDGSKFGFYHDDYPVSKSLFDPPTTLVAIVAWLLTLALTWRWRTIMPGFALGMGIFLVGQSLESSVFPLMLYFEHRNYLPAIGVVWAVLSLLTLAFARFHSRAPRLGALYGTAGCVFVLVLLAATSVRANVWKSYYTIVGQAVATHPNSRSAQFNMAALAFNANPPAFDQAAEAAAQLFASPDPNTHRIGAILKVMVDCRTSKPVPSDLLDAVFLGPPAAFEQDIMHAFEVLSDQVIVSGCGNLTAETMANGLAGLLDRWEPHFSPNWRLRYCAANLYMAAGRKSDAAVQARLTWAAKSPTNTSIMVAGILIDSGDLATASRILNQAETRLSAGDYFAQAVIADDREKLRKLKQDQPPAADRP